MINENIEQFEDILKNKTAEKYGFDEEDVEQYLRVCRRKLGIVKKGLCNVGVMNNQPELSLYLPDRGFYLTDDSMPHDIFRTGDSEDLLFSMEETNAFIERHKDRIYGYSKNWEERLANFWETYPDGMICF